MKKILLSIIIALLLVGTYFLLTNGLQIGAFNINGIYAVQDLGKKLDDKIEQAKNLTEVVYNESNKKLKNATEELQNKRQDYERKVALTNEEDVKKASTKEKYEIQFLWAKLGNYATKYGLKLTVDFKETTTGATGEKDLDFTLEGSYKGITNYLYALEDDDVLRIKIEDFELLPITVTSNSQTSASYLQAKFSIKELNVDLG